MPEVYTQYLWSKCVIKVIIELALEGGVGFVRGGY